MNLQALKSHLEGLGSPLTLSAEDAQLPPELAAFLTTAPNRQVVLTPGAGGISLSGSTLTVAGTSSDSWPIDGLTETELKLSRATLTVAGETNTAISLTAEATMPLGDGATADVAVASPAAPEEPWTLELTADVTSVKPQSLVDLAFGYDLPFQVPPELDVLTRSLVLDKDGFSLSFTPGRAADAFLSFAISAPEAKFTLLPDVAELDGLKLQGQVKQQSLSLAVISELEIDGVAVDLGVSFGSGDVWTAFISPPSGHHLPSVAQLADWIAGKGPSQAGKISTGFTNLGFDAHSFDLEITRLALSVDVKAMKLVAFEIDSVLTVAAIPLEVTLKLPHLTLAGALKEGTPVKVSDVFKAMKLPADDLPIDTEIAAVTFAATPGESFYMAELEIDEVAKAGGFDLEKISVYVAYEGAEGFDGRFLAQMTLWDLGTFDAMAEWSSTAGWTWSVGTPPGHPVELMAVIGKLGGEFGLEEEKIPEPIRTLELKTLALTLAPSKSVYIFQLVGDFEVADVPVEIAPTIEIHPASTGSGWSYHFGGIVTVGFVELELAFDTTTASSTTFVAALAVGTEAMPARIDVAELITALSPNLGKEVPAGLVVELKSAKLGTIGKPDGSRTLALALDLAASIALSNLPLVGDQLPPGESVSIEDLQVFYASKPVSTDEAQLLNTSLPPALQFPAAGLAEGAGLSAKVELAGQSETLSLGLATPSPPPQSKAPALPAGRAAGVPRQATPAAAAGQTAKWFDVQRKLGVVQFSRVGVLYEDSALFFAIDASLSLGALTISVDGLGVGSKLTEFEPEFTLTGAGVDFTQPPLHIGGAILRIVPPPKGTRYELNGSLVIEVEEFGIGAVGSYAVLESGAPSFFVFGQLTAPLGGPPAFFVTGLMAGFGVNRQLKVPAPTEVAEFPLLTMNEPGQTSTKVLEAIEQKEWITPSPGTDWFAAGLTATHFELVETRAVLVVELGAQLTIALLGLAILRLPQGEDSSSPYAYAELQIEAVLRPEEGYFGLTAILAPSSYVLVPACKLTGGFAFSVWFGDNEHAGQFVLTLGGYHPAFKVPAYFPTVPRLGFSWAVSSSVSISGGAYLAVTPSAAMAGGSLAALFQDGDLRAWFTANADLLISWRPFFFDAEINVEVGVSYRLNLLVCHKTIEITLGAGVHLWGPPTGGKVHVHLWCVSFTVPFGSDEAGGADEALKWPQMASLLPAAEAVVSFQPSGGLSKSLDSKTSTSGKDWVVRATGFSFTTEAAVPASHLCVGEEAKGEPTSGAVASAAPIAVKPMNLAAVTSVHRLIVRHESPTATPHDLGDWSLQARTRNVPDALWGKPPQPFTQRPAKPDAALVPEQQVGLAVTPPAPEIGPSRGAFPLAVLGAEEIGTGTMPLAPEAEASAAYLPVAAPTSVGAIATGIAGRTSLRGGLAAALGDLFTGEAGTMSKLGEEAGTLFAEAPMEEAAPH
jgi:hypothetical protein